MKTLQILTAAAAVLSVLGSASAFAQDAPPNMKQACMADVQRMCPNAAPGHGMVMQCIKGRMSEVSPGCQSAVQAHKAAKAARKAAAAQGAMQSPAPGAAPQSPPGAPPSGH